MRIDILVDGDGRIIARPNGYLDQLFHAYCAACNAAGSFYDRQAKIQVVPPESLVALTESLGRSGFDVYVGEPVERLIAERASALERDGAQFRDQVADVQAQIEERGLKLYGFQVEGVAKLRASERFLLADSPGLGKTVQALAALDTHRPAMIVAPAAVKGNWRNEAWKWRPDYRPQVLAGRGSFRWPRNGEVLVTNYENLPPTARELKEAKDGKRKGPSQKEQRMLFRLQDTEALEGTVLVGDELHMCKSKTALRTRRFAALAKHITGRGGRVWALTGTPILNRPPELWTILQILGLAKTAFPGGWEEFIRLFRGFRGAYNYSWGEPSPEVVDRIRRVSLRRRREDVLPDLPVKTHKDIEVSIDQQTRDQCDKVLEKLRSQGIDLEAAINEATRSKAMGVAFEEMSRARAMLATAKMGAMLEVVEEYEGLDEPLVVFSAHRAPIDALGYREGWATITGSTPAEQRTDIVRRFQEGELRGLGLTIKAGGTGLTLTRGAHMLFVDLEWTPALNSQAEDREVRIGQTRGVLILRLIADHPLDERVAELLLEKQRIIDASTDAASVTTVVGEGARVEKLKGLAQTAARLRQEAEARGLRPRTERASSDEPQQPTGKRGPALPVEEWAGRGLLYLADMDGDRARTKNGMGFSKFDSAVGQSLASQFRTTGRLSPRQWSACIRMITKYRAQIGDPPTEKPPEAGS